MNDAKREDGSSLLDKLKLFLSGLPWLKIVKGAWKVIQMATQRQSYAGMYEVLEYESTLELKDRGGNQATFRKRERVRYLQDNVIAYQDQAWGDGETLVNYRCTPGTPVDRYRSGKKTFILISRREIKNKGDVDEFHIHGNLRRGFLRRVGYWETHVSHQTTRVTIKVIFPKTRSPQHMTLTEAKRQRSHSLGTNALVRLPDGRTQVTWTTTKPRVHENYILQWEW